MPASEQVHVGVLCATFQLPMPVIDLHSPVVGSVIADLVPYMKRALPRRARIRRRTATVLFRSIRLTAQERRDVQVFQIRLLYRRMTITDRLLAHDRRTFQLAVIDFAIAIALDQLDRRLL